MYSHIGCTPSSVVGPCDAEVVEQPAEQLQNQQDPSQPSAARNNVLERVYGDDISGNDEGLEAGAEAGPGREQGRDQAGAGREPEQWMAPQDEGTVPVVSLSPAPPPLSRRMAQHPNKSDDRFCGSVSQ